MPTIAKAADIQGKPFFVDAGSWVQPAGDILHSLASLRRSQLQRPSSPVQLLISLRPPSSDLRLPSKEEIRKSWFASLTGATS